MDKVLHVTEALGGGITTAIESYVRSTRAEFDHCLLYSARAKHNTGSDLAEIFDSVHLAHGTLDLSRQLRRVVREQRPDVVHLHSSIAGAIGRVALRKSTVPIVYTPHCFDFERTDSFALRTRATKLVERQLARNTSLVIGVSPHEADLARDLGVPAHYVPNVVNESLPSLTKRSYGADIVTIGRVSHQKDPGFFARVVTLAAASQGTKPSSVTWIGDGPPDLRAVLADAGVTVTGWLPRVEVLARLSRADVYLHTAAWEGSPMSLLEASAMRVAIVARSIPSLTSLGFTADLTTPQAVAARLGEVLSDPGSHAGCGPDPGHDSAARQTLALTEAYRAAIKLEPRRPGRPAED